MAYQKHFRVGNKVRVAIDNDNENYNKFRNKILRITHVARNINEHRGYDEMMEGQYLYDLEEAKSKKPIPFSLYDYELEGA